MSREKQIEEMAVILTDGGCTECNCDANGKFSCLPMYEAELLYNAGYRKQSEPISCGHEKCGEWIDKPTGAYSRMQSWCSACGKHSGIGGIESNRHKPYCPNCGAKMKGGAE